MPFTLAFTACAAGEGGLGPGGGGKADHGGTDPDFFQLSGRQARDMKRMLELAQDTPELNGLSVETFEEAWGGETYDVAALIFEGAEYLRCSAPSTAAGSPPPTAPEFGCQVYGYAETESSFFATYLFGDEDSSPAHLLTLLDRVNAAVPGVGCSDEAYTGHGDSGRGPEYDWPDYHCLFDPRADIELKLRSGTLVAVTSMMDSGEESLTLDGAPARRLHDLLDAAGKANEEGTRWTSGPIRCKRTTGIHASIPCEIRARDVRYAPSGPWDRVRIVSTDLPPRDGDPVEELVELLESVDAELEEVHREELPDGHELKWTRAPSFSCTVHSGSDSPRDFCEFHF